jgi:hypothetical protein
MIKEYLSENYQEEIREILQADETLFPNKFIEADLNIGGANMILEGMLESCVPINNDKRKEQVCEAAKLYLCGVLCVMLKTRDKSGKNWEYRRMKCMDKANKIMIKLFK